MQQPLAARDALANAGFEPQSFDIVLNTHLHWDHAGGNTTDEAGGIQPAFPNARYHTQRGELLHAREQHPRDAVSYRAVNYEPLIESGVMQPMEGDGDIVPGVFVQVVPGHNRNMTIVTVRSGRAVWRHLADLVMYGAQVTPTWVSGFDLFPLEAVDNRMRILGAIAAEQSWCSFAHDPAIAFAKIKTEQGRWQVQQALS
jgi:glyoxylase-like metal-dependent hydrolase (beta-lactamase superfamily II)